MALEYTLTETLTPEEYKNSFVNFYRQVLGMDDIYGGGGGGGSAEDTFTPQQTTISYSDKDDDGVNIDNFDIKTIDPSSIGSLPDLDLEGADKPDRLSTFEIGDNPTLRDRLLKNGEKLIQQGLPSFVGLTGGVAGAAVTAGMTSLVGGSSYVDEAGKTQFRPDGILGTMGDFARQQRRQKLQAIQAGPSVTGDRGTAFTVGNMTIVRGPGDMSYTGNRQGLSHKQLKNIEALQQGILPETFRFERDKDGTNAMFTGGRKVNQSIGADGGLLIDPNDPTKGFYRGDGAIYSLRFGYAPVGMMSDVETLAKNYFPGMDAKTARDLALSAIQNARAGNGTVSSNLYDMSPVAQVSATIGASKRRDDADDDKPTVKPTSTAPTQKGNTQAQIDAAIAADKARRDSNKDDPVQRYADSDAGRQAEQDALDEGLNQGGFIGMNNGGSVPSESGFVDGVPPSQTTDAQEVADDRPTQLPEGAFVLNASSVEFAGEQDISKMLLDAHEEALRRGVVSQGTSGEATRKMIDVAVSRGEVVVAPYMVKIIGLDRLEKINKRGIKDTERKIEENGQQPQGLAEGGGMLEISQTPVDFSEYRKGMSTIEAVVAFSLGVLGDVNKSIAVSEGYRKTNKTEDDIEDTLRHILLGGLTASVEDDNFFVKGQRGVAEFLIDDIREANHEYKAESAIDLNNNEFGRALRRKFPDKDQFTRAAIGSALLLQSGDAQEIDGISPQLSLTGR